MKVKNQNTIVEAHNCEICRTRIDYGCQLYNIASAGNLKKLDSFHREGIRIYTGAFRTSPVESLHVEENDPPWN